jgi:pimeloyl-ACP methyl ester carboxylesterase
MGCSTMKFFFALLLLLSLAPDPARAETETVLHDEYVVNGHAGYLSAWAKNGPLDRVLLIVPGFDIENDSMPIDELYDDLGWVTGFMGLFGWDVIYFDYLDGSTDLKINAANLAHFIRYLDTRAEPGYHLALVGGSMGGIVARTMFVQENEDMGVDTYVTIDSPHRGVHLSEWAEDLAVQLLDYQAAHQMHEGDPLYNEHYGWLREVESTARFRNAVNGPMNTCAIALSDGSQGEWEVGWEQQFLHNKFFPVSSYFEFSGLRSTYMPYHSTVYLDSDATRREFRWGYTRYEYRDLRSSYFDRTIANPADEHGAPDYAIIQALVFVVENAPR